jgi:hypothetical protein
MLLESSNRGVINEHGRYILVGEPYGKRPLEITYVNVGDKIILKWLLNKHDGRF